MGRKVWLTRLSWVSRFVSAVLVALACTDADSANENEAQPTASSAINIPSGDCGVARSSVLTGSGIGDLRIGTAVAPLRGRCRVVADTTVEFGNEGMPERRVTIALGVDSLDATIVDDRVWRIEVRTPRFRTADSLGVGSTVRDIRRGPSTLATGDRGVFVLRRDHCGLSFQLAGVSPGRGENWARIPDTTRVALVLVFGCQESDSAPRS